MKVIGTYGSLKKGCYNYERFEMGARSNFLGESKIRGAMDLFAGSYPRLYPEGTYPDLEATHALEIYEIPDDLYKQFDMMEKGAGYQPHTIKALDREVTVWLMNPAYEIDMEFHISHYPVTH